MGRKVLKLIIYCIYNSYPIIDYSILSFAYSYCDRLLFISLENEMHALFSYFSYEVNNDFWFVVP